jgi:hypothetical protein
VESLERWIPVIRAQRRQRTDVRPPPDTTHSLELATLEVVGRDTDERSDLRTAELATFWAIIVVLLLSLFTILPTYGLRYACARTAR